MKKAIIIEDEEMAARRLRKLIKNTNHDIQIVAHFSSVSEAENYFKDDTTDLVFLDIQLEDGTAFDLLASVTISCPIIFTTAYDAYAQKAFEHNAFDYLMKPIQKHALQSVLDKLMKSPDMNSRPGQALITNENGYNLLIRYGSRYHVIQQQDIAYIYESEGLVVLVNHENETLPINISLSDLNDKLKDSRLVMVSPTFLVHLNAIREILDLKHDQVELIIYPPPEIPLIFPRQTIDSLIKRLSESNLIIS